MVNIRGFEIVSDKFRKNPDKEITLPTRATSMSAGYDFSSPIDIEIYPHDKVVIWTDVKAYMKNREVLMLYVRSSIGIKKGLTLGNGTGIIDCDYHNNETNDGNIGICLYNNTDGIVSIKEGERISQGIFIEYLVADNGNVNKDRTGGIGSSN
jgi:dUTP pyrophosphatase